MALQAFSFVLFIVAVAIALLVGFMIVALLDNAFFAVSPHYAEQFNSKYPIVPTIYVVYGALFFLIFLLLAVAIRKG